MFHRALAHIIPQISATFRVLLVTGPRQVGKTTLLEMCAEAGRHYVSLDDLEQRDLARRDPALFLQSHPTPLIIDEIQYAPELLSQIKLKVDSEKQNGLFWLTGSQKFHLMKGVTESLAGRVAIIDLLGLSQAERAQRIEPPEPFLPTHSWINGVKTRSSTPSLLPEVYQAIWQGAFPALWKAIDSPDKEGGALSPSPVHRELFYKSYVQTYIQRDVRDMVNIMDETGFNRFLRAVAARTGQLLNYSDIARDVDIDHKTAKAWLSALEASGLVYLLQPYHRNVTKRLVKTPKLYFLDTGLCSYLTQWPTPESLEAGAMSGAILETYLVSEILKSYWFAGVTPYVYYYRDLDQKEVDLIIESGDTLYPVEFKKTASPSKNASKQFNVLEKLGRPIGPGGVLCLVEQAIPLSQEVTAIPIGYL